MAPLTRAEAERAAERRHAARRERPQMYMASPEYMATYARHLVQAGAKVIGGCCGTTPEHIHAMVEGMRPLSPRHRGRTAVRRATAATRRPARTPAADGRERRRPAGPVRRALALGGEARARGVRHVGGDRAAARRRRDAHARATSRALKAAGVDAVNVPDGPRAQSRMGALMTSLLIEQQVGIETVTHYCLPRPQPARHAERPARRVGDRAAQPARSSPAIRRRWDRTRRDGGLRHRLDRPHESREQRSITGSIPAATRSAQPTRFAIGVGVNPAAIDPEHELRRFEWKVEAGAEYAITQPVFDAGAARAVPRDDRADAHPDHRRDLAARLGAQRGVPRERGAGGRRCPTEIIARMRQGERASRRNTPSAEGIAIAREMLARVRGAVQGVQVSAPFGRAELAIAVIRGGG